MTKSATPRTDEIAKPIEEGTGYECDAILLLELCRQLELKLAKETRKRRRNEPTTDKFAMSS